MPRNRVGLISVLVSAALALSCGNETPQLTLERAAIRMKGKTVTVELAREPWEQERGLMFRRSLGESEGMLFMYDSPRMMSFWMKNTRIPLSIAFLDREGIIVNIEQMRPYDDSVRYRSAAPAQYALEMNRGWFERNGVGVGDRVEIPRLPHALPTRDGGQANPKSQIPKREE